MHEYKLTLDLIRLASERSGGARIRAVNLVVGETSGILADCVALYFETIAEGTLCEGAELRMERVRPLLKCDTCEKLFERKPFCFDCDAPGCSGQGMPTEIGREFYIKSIELEGESNGSRRDAIGVCQE